MFKVKKGIILKEKIIKNAFYAFILLFKSIQSFQMAIKSTQIHICPHRMFQCGGGVQLPSDGVLYQKDPSRITTRAESSGPLKKA